MHSHPITWLQSMSAVIHVRIPRQLKEKIDELGINVSEEVRKYLEKRVRQAEMERIAALIRSRLQRMRKVSDSTQLIRQDRESR